MTLVITLALVAGRAQTTNSADVAPTNAASAAITNASANSLPQPGANSLPQSIATNPAGTQSLQSGIANGMPADTLSKSNVLDDFQARLEEARNLRLSRQATVAEPMLTALLAGNAPEEIQREALLELAMAAQDESDLARAQQIYAQFISRWSSDQRIPEIYLRQGRLFRQMGLNSLALAKFYGVMTAALALKNDQMDYYQRLVLEAQIEIAETHYQSGQFAEAADFFSRLLKQNSSAIDRPEIQFRLVRSLYATTNYTESASQAQDYLSRFAKSSNEPEVRFYLALALKELGQNNESLREVLTLLQEQKTLAQDHPEVWAYWQQRAGNEIANQLFREGDYTKALDIYLSLKQLDHSAAWQFPVTYQIGMTYEKLLQPQMAMESYSNIVGRAGEVGTNGSPGLNATVDMARWRINFLQWQTHAESVNQVLAAAHKSASRKTNPETTAIQ